jgi:hypothetical protein
LDLRNITTEKKKGDEAEDLDYLPELKDLKLLNMSGMSGRFYMTVPEEALVPIPKNDRYVRRRGGKAGLKVAKAPHIFWSISSAAYSNEDFVFPNPQIGLSAPKEDAEHLRALAAYLNTSFAQYLLFFEAASWGVDRSKFAKNEVAPVHIPNFSQEQIRELAALHRKLNEIHAPDEQRSLFNKGDRGPKMLSPELKIGLTKSVGEILRIPEHIKVLASDFTEVRYQLLKGKTTGSAAKPASAKDLTNYANYLTESLDSFAKKHHKVDVERHGDFAHCKVQITRSKQPHKPTIGNSGNGNESVPTSLKKLWTNLGYGFSQWVYVQRGLRLFIGDTVHLLKSSRLIDWTKTQAIMDSDDIIAEVLSDQMD